MLKNLQKVKKKYEKIAKAAHSFEIDCPGKKHNHTRYQLGTLQFYRLIDNEKTSSSEQINLNISYLKITQ